MSECASTRGEWGGICPACGVRLPEDRGPLESWTSQREWMRHPERKREATLNAFRRDGYSMTVMPGRTDRCSPVPRAAGSPAG